MTRCINCQLYTCDVHTRGAEKMTEEFIGFYSSILINAIEGGGTVGSWRVKNYEWKDQENSQFIIAKAELITEDPEYVKAMITDNHVCVDHNLVSHGMNKLLSGEVEASGWIIEACKRAVQECDGSYMDSICCDVVLQSAVFEEVIYG